MKLVKNKLFLILMAVVISFCSIQAVAQPGDPQEDPDPVPITGLEYLLISGGVFGGYKLLRKRIKGDSN